MNLLRDRKEGDFTWHIEIYTFPHDYTEERHDAGDYDIVSDVAINDECAASVGQAAKRMKSIERKLGYDRKPGALQWEPRMRRLWWDGLKWTIDEKGWID